MRKLNKNYVSELDNFLTNQRQQVSESISQRQEREQYEAVFRLRDHPQTGQQGNALDLE